MKTAMKIILATAVLATSSAALAGDYKTKSTTYKNNNYREYNRDYTVKDDIKYNNMDSRAGVGISDKRDAAYGMQRGIPSRDQRSGYSGTYMGYKVESYANPGDIADSMRAVRHSH